MTYDSPKTIRRRQQRQNDKPRRTKRTPEIKTFTGPVWAGVCDFHIERIQEHIEQGHAEAAGRHAETLVHMACTRRALELMGVKPMHYYLAMMKAGIELYGEGA